MKTPESDFGKFVKSKLDFGKFSKTIENQQKTIKKQFLTNLAKNNLSDNFSNSFIFAVKLAIFRRITRALP